MQHHALLQNSLMTDDSLSQTYVMAIAASGPPPSSSPASHRHKRGAKIYLSSTSSISLGIHPNKTLIYPHLHLYW